MRMKNQIKFLCNMKEKARFLSLSLLFLIPSLSHAERPAWEWKPRYYNEWRLGYGTTHKENGADYYIGRAIIGTIHGAKFNEYLQVGVGIDGVMFTHYYKDKSMRWALNGYVDMRGFYPVNNKFKVFLDLGLGTIATLNASSSVPYGKNSTGFLCQFGPGLQYKKFTLTTGLQHCGEKSNTFYSTLGFTF